MFRAYEDKNFVIIFYRYLSIARRVGKEDWVMTRDCAQWEVNTSLSARSRRIFIATYPFFLGEKEAIVESVYASKPHFPRWKIIRSRFSSVFEYFSLQRRSLKGLSFREKRVRRSGRTRRARGGKNLPLASTLRIFGISIPAWNVLSLSLRREELVFLQKDLFIFSILFLPRFWLEILVNAWSNILCSFRRAGVPRSRRRERNAVYVFYSGISTIRRGCLSITGKRDKALTWRR